MSDHHHNGPFPRGPLLGAGLVVALALLSAATARLTGTKTMVPDAAPLMERDLRFVDQVDGGIAVYPGTAAHPLEIVPPGGNNGFLRATLRGLATERKREGAGSEKPFRLTGWSDGRLTLDDPATGRHVELEAFGETNARAFAHFLTLPRS